MIPGGVLFGWWPALNLMCGTSDHKLNPSSLTLLLTPLFSVTYWFSGSTSTRLVGIDIESWEP